MEGLCNLLHTQTGAGNCRDIPVAQHVGLIVCCKEGELVPQRTVDRLSQRMLGTTCYRTWACVRWFGGWFKAVGLCFGLDDVRKQAWLGVLADGTGRWVGWICWCWTGESSGHPYSPGWGGGCGLDNALFLSAFRHGGGVALALSCSISITESSNAGMLCHCPFSFASSLPLLLLHCSTSSWSCCYWFAPDLAWLWVPRSQRWRTFCPVFICTAVWFILWLVFLAITLSVDSVQTHGPCQSEQVGSNSGSPSC